ncbi:hypothetical protein [Dyella sp.]|uniref:hypothetical protein n=1 Tax=Dyella sp. TaxID=1869338 RepID=UPI002B49952B|nr:hypothetical protein [Dyella sp.]HKT28377.1 hypothetical protein [Dyella sp.]
MTTDYAPVNFNDLLEAFIWVSGGNLGSEPEAYVSRQTGKVYWSGIAEFGVDEDLPEDIGDSDRYVPVPHKNDLDLGRDLVFRFAEQYLPDSCELVYHFFRRQGAYGRFKDLLDRKGQLEHWHDYEDKATRQSLRDWAQENGLAIVES